MAYKLTSIWVDEDVKKRIMKLAIDNGVPFGKMLEILADNFKIQEEGKIDGQGFND